MIVKISDYGKIDEKYFVEYRVYGLSAEQMNFVNENLDDETVIFDEELMIKLYFSSELYPFQSDVAKSRLDDFIAREEIEMNIFLSSFLEDML